MTTTKTGSWISGWDEPPQIDFVDVPAGTGSWEKGLRSHFEYRDLGLAHASRGSLGAQHIRYEGSGGRLNGGWHCHDLDFQFFYVLKGWIRLRIRGDEEITLHAGDSGYHPGLYWHEEIECAPDYEVLEITAPAEFATIHGRDSKLPARAADLDPERGPVYTSDTTESYVVGAGPRSFFAYRDLGTSAATDGRIHIHTVAVAGQQAIDQGTGWHYHTMAQWFFILEGTADLRVESLPRRHLVAGDAICIGSGPQMRHVVGPIAGDYKLVEMCVPAVYETIAVERPPGAAG